MVLRQLDSDMGAARTLAINGHDLALGQRAGTLNPVPKTLLEPGCVQPRPSVSCEGMPWGSSSKVRSQASLS